MKPIEIAYPTLKNTFHFPFIILMFLFLNPAFGFHLENKPINPTLKNEIKVIQLKEGHFLIVGSFSLLRNAESYSKSLISQSMEAKLGFYSGTQNFYVYLYQSSDVAKVRKLRDQIRHEEQFKEAWVLSLDNHEPFEKNNTEIIAQQNFKQGNIKGNSGGISSSEPIAIESQDENSMGNKVAMKQFKVYMNVVDARTFKELDGVIKVIQGEKDKFFGGLTSHQTQLVKLPVTDVENVQLECEVFGYKKIQQDFNFNNPTSFNMVHMQGDTIVVDFELMRYQKGNVFTMYNVFFHNDAAVMLSKSTHELNSLVEMVQENPNLRIMLHGHTNGNDHGKIISLGKKSKDFFTITPDNKIGSGSAKKLSLERAETIKRYLMVQGIEENRIEVKGWGGKKMLYPIGSPNAKKNVRVEVEILQD